MVKKGKVSSNLTLILVLLISILLLNYLWPKKEIDQAKLGLSRWPFSVKKHLDMSRAFFNYGDQTQAIEEYKKAEELYSVFSFLDFEGKNKEQLIETEKLIYSPEEIRKKIENWQTVLQTKPYFRDVLIHLSASNYQIYENEKAQEYWQQAYYLDPNNDLVQQVGQIINQ